MRTYFHDVFLLCAVGAHWSFRVKTQGKMQRHQISNTKLQGVPFSPSVHLLAVPTSHNSFFSLYIFPIYFGIALRGVNKKYYRVFYYLSCVVGYTSVGIRPLQRKPQPGKSFKAARDRPEITSNLGEGGLPKKSYFCSNWIRICPLSSIQSAYEKRRQLRDHPEIMSNIWNSSPK